MKKQLLFFLVALFTLSLTSCSDDDDIYYITEGDVNGVYLGAMDVEAPFGGVDLGATGVKQKIYVTKTGENLVKLQLKNFEFREIPVGDIEVDQIAVSKVNETFTLKGEGNLKLIVGGCNVTVDGSIDASGNCSVLIRVKVTEEGDGLNFVGLNVKVDFAGKKMEKDLSSEALITEFNFNDEEIYDVVIYQENKLIVFYSPEGKENLKMTPTITVSAGATISPASGTEQNFANDVIYTVTSEDGINSVKYSVKRGNINRLDFEDWVTINSNTSGSDEHFQLPQGTWGSTNDGIMSANDMLGSALEGLGLSRFEYPVQPSGDAFEGEKSVLIKTIDMLILAPQPDGSVMDFNAALGGLIPYNTAGSLFLGEFHTDMNDMLASTKFGVPYAEKPVKFVGNYKYSPGEFYREGRDTVEKSDEFAIYALLYEAVDEAGNEVTLIGGSIDPEKNEKFNIDHSPYVVLRADLPYDGPKTEWTSFEIPFVEMNGKAYNPNKTYKLTIVCTSSKDGAHYNGAPGSTLFIDDLGILSE